MSDIKIYANGVEIDYDALMQRHMIEQTFRSDLKNAKGYFAKLKVMARVYDYLKRIDTTKVSWHIKHLVDLRSLFTPIEEMVWDDMMYFGLIMYPQYPALNYTLDFADPFKMIAIEVDGKEWHQDKKKDIKRHLELEKAGWTVYHIPGGDCVRWVDQFYDIGMGPNEFEEDEFIERRHKILQATSGGLIVCILAHHYNCKHIALCCFVPESPEYYLLLNREKFFYV